MYRNNIQWQITNAAYRIFETLVHELFHVAAKNGTLVGHKTLDQAALNLDSSLKFKDYEPSDATAPLFNAYIRKYCTPEKFVTEGN